MRYTIPSGRNNDNGILTKLMFFRYGRKMSGTFLLEHDSYYEKEEQLHDGKDKLVGFGGWNPHNNSARIATQPNWELGEGWVNIYAYCYLDGERVTQLMTTLHTGWKVEWSVQALKDYGYRLIVNGVDNVVDINWNGKQPRFRRYDRYHGGESVAPKEENSIINTKILHL